MPQVFISYSRKDKKLVDHCLGFLEYVGERRGFDVWYDVEGIEPGEEFPDKIRSAIDQSILALTFISIDFLRSDFIQRKELPHLLRREKSSKLRIVPVLLRESPWKQESWLVNRNLLPTGAKPLASSDRADEDCTLLAEWVADHIEQLLRQRITPIPANRPLRILGEKYDPFRAVKATYQAIPEEERPLQGPVQFIEAQHDEILDELEIMAGSDTYRYDIISMPSRAVGYCADKGVIEPLPAKFTDLYGDKFLWWNALGTHNDVLYGVPQSALTMLLAVREDLFDQFDLKPPDTWEEYLSVIEQVVQRRLPIMPEVLEAEHHVTMWYVWLNYLYAHRTNDLFIYREDWGLAPPEEERLRIATRDYLQVAQRLSEHIRHVRRDIQNKLDVTVEHPMQTNWNNAIDAFRDGAVLMHLVFNDAIKDISGGLCGERVRFLPVPKAFGASLRFGHASAWVMCVCKHAKYAPHARKFLEWYLSEDTQRQYLDHGGATASLAMVRETAAQPDDRRAFYESIKDTLEGSPELIRTKSNNPNALGRADSLVPLLHKAVNDVTRARNPQTPDARAAKFLTDVRNLFRRLS